MADPAVAGVFVGVDSGGTRTNVRVERYSPSSDDPVEQYTYEVSESLSGALPPDRITATLRKIVAPFAAWTSRTDQSGRSVHMWVSAAGFSAWTREEYLMSIQDIGSQLSDVSLKTVGAANDAVTLLLGTRADGIVIAGTGTSVVMRDRDGALHQSGGHEWVACDDGSGFWIGLRAIRRAYRDLENGLDSVLLHRMCDVYNIRHDDRQALIERIRELAVGHKNTKRDIAKFAASVCDAAERGDVAAQDIVKSQAEDLADVTAGALRRRFTRQEQEDGLKIVQCGSLLSNAFYRSTFEAHLHIRLLSSDQKPTELHWERIVTGDRPALSLARDLANGADVLGRLDPSFRPAIFQSA